MKFCNRCGSLLEPIKEGKLRCKNCGHKEGGEAKVKKKEKKKEDIIVVEEEMETRPKAEIICPKCSHNEAYWWTRQTRSGDEAPTSFFECCKCGHKWREY